MRQITEDDIAATAVAILTRAARTITDYQQEVDRCAEKGFTPEYCIHGAYLWVDHDIPCGACELGDDIGAVTVNEAIEHARDTARQIETAYLDYLAALRRGVMSAKTLAANTDLTREQRHTYVRLASTSEHHALTRLTHTFIWAGDHDD